MVIIPSIVFFIAFFKCISFFPCVAGKEQSRAERSGGRQASVHSFHTGQTQMMKCHVEKKHPIDGRNFLTTTKARTHFCWANTKQIKDF